MATQPIDLTEHEKFQAGQGGGEAPPIPGFSDTLIREGKAAGQTLIGMPKALYHAAADAPTAEEKASGNEKFIRNIGPTGRLIERSVIQPTKVAGEYYNKLIHASPSDRSAMESDMLSVAPEAMGSAAGNVALGGAVKSGVDIAKGAPVGRTIVGETKPGTVGGKTPLPFRSIAEPAIRGAVKTTNVVAPAAAGAGTGALIGTAFGHPMAGAEIGALPGLGGSLIRGVREMVPKIPGEKFGEYYTAPGGELGLPKMEPVKAYGGAPMSAAAKAAADAGKTDLIRLPGKTPKYITPAEAQAFVTKTKLGGQTLASPGQIKDISAQLDTLQRGSMTANDMRAHLQDPRVQAEGGMRDIAQVLKSQTAPPRGAAASGMRGTEVAPEGKLPPPIDISTAREAGGPGSKFAKYIKGTTVQPEELKSVEQMNVPEGKRVEINPAAEQAPSELPLIRGQKATPQEVGSIEEQRLEGAPTPKGDVGGVAEAFMRKQRMGEPAPTEQIHERMQATPEEEVQSAAAEEVSKRAEPKPEIDPKVDRQHRHLLGDYVSDKLHSSAEGIEAAERMGKMSYGEYADVANELGVEKPKAVVEKARAAGQENPKLWSEADFKRTVKTHGKELNPLKEQITRHMVDNHGPVDILEMTEGMGKGTRKPPAAPLK